MSGGDDDRTKTCASDNVIRLKDVAEPGLKRISRKFRECRHEGRFDISDYRRVAECAKCGEAVDPIDVLLKLAHEWDKYRSSIQRIEQDATMKLAELERVKRDERNAKSRLRRLNARLRALEIACGEENG